MTRPIIYVSLLCNNSHLQYVTTRQVSLNPKKDFPFGTALREFHREIKIEDYYSTQQEP